MIASIESLALPSLAVAYAVLGLLRWALGTLLGGGQR